MSRIRMLCGLVAIVSLFPLSMPGPAHSHPGWNWTVAGSFRVGLGSGCDDSPTCQAFLSGEAVGRSCDPALAHPDGIETSIAQLLPGVEGQTARFDWTGDPGFVLKVNVGQIGGPGPHCQDLGSVEVPNWRYFPQSAYGSAIIELHEEARFIYVNAAEAINVRWVLVGMDQEAGTAPQPDVRV